MTDSWTFSRKLDFFEKNLLSFHKKYKRKNLPWRKRNITPYEVWVSEIFLQQTQLARVVNYYSRFLKRFPDIFTLAKCSWKNFISYYRGLGYYKRGQNMLQCAKIIVKKYSGFFPNKKEELEKLPGIGEYTANAILSFGFNKNYLAYDTNLKKVFGRFLHGNKDAKIKTVDLAQALKSNKRILNAAIMDFANTVCLKNPRCHICPLSRRCQYYKTHGKLEEKKKRSAHDFPIQQAQVYLWLHQNHQKYYSSHPRVFKVFIISPKNNTRNGMKRFFKNKFGLELAIRPPHKKTFINKKPTLFVNAQILLGRPAFQIFPKEDVLKFDKRLMTK